MKVNFVADPGASNELFYVNYLKRIPKTKTSHIEIHVILFYTKNSLNDLVSKYFVFDRSKNSVNETVSKSFIYDRSEKLVN